LTIDENIESTYRFKAVNKAGTESAISDSYTVKIDKEKPVITATANTTNWTNTAPIITVNTFANSGIAEILYSENGGEWLILDGDTLTAKDGVNTYRFKAISVSGMESSTVTVTTKAELLAPILTAEIDGVTTDWTNENVSFTLTATNTNSGVTYYVNYGDEWVKLSRNSFTIKDNGTYTIEVKAVNTAGSESNILEYTVKIDKEKPVITAVNSSDGKWTADSVNISVNAQANSGIESVFYTLDGVAWSVLEGGTLSFDEDCEKTLAIKAVSNSGLESDVILTDVKIEKTAPVINVSFKPVKNNSKIEQIAFGLSSENTKSGATYYYNDGSGWQMINENELLILNIKSGKYIFKVVNGAGNSSEVSSEFKVEVRSVPSSSTSANKNNQANNNEAKNNSVSVKSNPKVSYYQYSKDGVNWTELNSEEAVNAEKYFIRPIYKDGTKGEEIEVYIAKAEVNADGENIKEPSEPTVNVDKDGDKNDGNGTKIVMLFFGILAGAGGASTLFIIGGKRRKKESD
ncbi:MAG TPA: PKD domain-containing protein, partial [Oscillospiraceae bacterium]|nr:PKD domain-containing protein [Oscillospiraceae bacterium]